jgi:hypothetical protein
MKRTIVNYIYGIAVALVIFCALGWAGQSDYEDAVISEMKNNGAYFDLSAQHPDATDSELVNIYEQLKNEKK